MPAAIRTCVGCRQRGPAVEMIRLAAQDGRVVIAPASAIGGRGASVHPRPSCVTGALKSGVLARAFKRPVVAAAAFLEDLTLASRNRKLGTP